MQNNFKKNSCKWITPTWPAPQRVKALTTLREGGESQGSYVGFNLAAHVGDDIEAVQRNRFLLLTEAGLPAEPCWLTQVHGTHVISLEKYREEYKNLSPQVSPSDSTPDSSSDSLDTPPDSPEADASIALHPNLVAAVLTADCLPILMTDTTGSFIAAIHAGWRGLAKGVIESTFEKLKKELPQIDHKNILVWFGPAIGPQAFIVGEEVSSKYISISKNPFGKTWGISSIWGRILHLYRIRKVLFLS